MIENRTSVYKVFTLLLGNNVDCASCDSDVDYTAVPLSNKGAEILQQSLTVLTSYRVSFIDFSLVLEGDVAQRSIVCRWT